METTEYAPLRYAMTPEQRELEERLGALATPIVECRRCGAREFRPESGQVYCYGGRRAHAAALMVEVRP
jgi:hypothetical protein